MRRIHSAALAALAAGLACDESQVSDDTGDDVQEDPRRPDAEFRYHTKYVDVAPMSDAPVCTGTLRAMDVHIEALITDLGLEPDRRIPVYFFHPGDDLLAWCLNPKAAGCYSYAIAIVLTYAQSLPHEFVHALAPGLSWWSEGIAYGFSTLPSPPANTETWHSKLGWSGHLSRWIVETFGPETYWALFTGTARSATQADVEGTVRDVLGMEFPEMLSEYAATAPWQYPSPWSCQVPPEVVEAPWVGSFWRSTANFDCEAPTTFNGDSLDEPRMVVRLPVSIPASGRYMFLADHPQAELNLWPCSPELLIAPPPAGNLWEAVFSLTLSAPLLEEGFYVLAVSLPLGAPVHVEVQGYLSIGDPTPAP